MRVGLLPAAGTASRMRGLPKFLLPVSENVQTLIEHHVELLADLVERIYIPARPENMNLLERLSLPSTCELIAMNTETMSETVHRALEAVEFDNCVLGMPDTFYVSRNPYIDLSRDSDLDVKLALWRTKPSQRGQVGSIELDDDNTVLRCEDKTQKWDFGQHWGAMRFNRRALSLLEPTTPHAGFLITPSIEDGLSVKGEMMDGEYFDCGTFSEYKRCVASL
jgi:MobA-like NTP transferase domain